MSDKKFYQEVCKTMEYKEKIKQLEKRNKEIYDGFLAMSNERCEYAVIVDKVEKCIKEFLCTEDYINVDGKAIADNYKNILDIIRGDNNE